ncbi:hypothetical protein ACHHYP_15938 [Achlya hypogyna]|uniref:WRKY transcription factor 19 n=1 Tax=Achlya hypogyna TaxID=1202772 RepID=A0A1V9Y9V2_ACHHY|nr:hypothetical protein ACHHYP_15938 [Achlya hypogyna]
MSSANVCCFNGCQNVSLPLSDKCVFHRNRAVCLVEDCINQVYARHLCVRHGGKKTCCALSCSSHARIGDYCVRHSKDPAKQLCSEDGCRKTAHRRQKCVRHGGGRPCHVSGCPTHARAGGLCWRHRNLVLPTVEASTLALRDDEFLAILDEWMATEEVELDSDSFMDDLDCLLADYSVVLSHVHIASINVPISAFPASMAPGPGISGACVFNGCPNRPVKSLDKCKFHRGRAKCAVDNCANQVYARQRCIRHGGKRSCVFPGCHSNARSGSFCCRHGADNTKQLCSQEGCDRVAHLRQRCVRHGGGRPCLIDGCTTHARAGGYCWRHRKCATADDMETDVMWIHLLQELAHLDETIDSAAV